MCVRVVQTKPDQKSRLFNSIALVIIGSQAQGKETRKISFIIVQTIKRIPRTKTTHPLNLKSQRKEAAKRTEQNIARICQPASSARRLLFFCISNSVTKDYFPTIVRLSQCNNGHNKKKTGFFKLNFIEQNSRTACNRTHTHAHKRHKLK